MIKDYLTDEVHIIPVTTDVDGVETEGAPVTAAARIEDWNRLVKDREGKEVASDTLVILDDSETITYESKIKLRKQCGVATTDPEKKHAVLTIEKAHGFEGSHWEVRL